MIPHPDTPCRLSGRIYARNYAGFILKIRVAYVLLRLSLTIDKWGTDGPGTNQMKVICSWCKIEGLPAMIREKEPFCDRRETHSICPDHLRQLSIDVDESSAIDASG